MAEYVRVNTFISDTSYGSNQYPYNSYYSYKAYSWDTNSHTGGHYSSGNITVAAVTQTRTIDNKTFVVYIPGQVSPPFRYSKRYEVLDTFDTPVFNPVSAASPTKTVRAHHAGLTDSTYGLGTGAGLTFLETHNPLKIDFDATRDVTSIGLDSSTTPGKVRLHVRPQDGATPLEFSYDVPGLPDPVTGLVLRASLHLRGSSAPLTWVTLTPTPNQSGLDASCEFAVTTVGTYDYQVRAYFNDPDEAGADWSQYYDPSQLKGSVTVSQVQEIKATIDFITPIGSAPTEHRRAEGTLSPKVRATYTGPITGTDLTITMRLFQDGVELDTTHNATRVGSSDIYQADFTHLPAGSYTVLASLRNTKTPLDKEEIGQVDPPPLEIGDQLTFVPWLQPRLGHDALVLAATTTSSAASLRPQVPLSATLTTDRSGTETVAATTAQLAGPGDVQGLAQRAILNTWPAPGATSCSPLELVQIDFQDEDLPWRYSTLHTPATTARPTPEPLPWLMLLVLKNDGVEYQRRGQSGALPSILVKGGLAGTYPSPAPAQQQLWAHVQLNDSFGKVTTPATQPDATDVQTYVDTKLPKNPALANSRIFSARRLAENTEYQAFVVPAVEAGRLAGLGLDFAPADLGQSAIPAGGGDCAFPVYFQWKFSTGTDEDFESLTGRLAAASTAAAAAPTLAVTVDGLTYQLPMPGALADAAAPAPGALPATTQLRVAKYLREQVQPAAPATGRPVVAAPLYGRAYMVRPTLLPATSPLPPGWKHQLNLDPRYRALAALGAEVVRDNQEEYVRRAWDQVQDILLANEKLRGAQYGLRTTAGLRDQHLPLTTTTTTTGGTGRRLALRTAAPQATEDTEATQATEATEATQATEDTGDTQTFQPAKASQTFQPTGTAQNTQTSQPAVTHGMADYGLHLTALAQRRTRLSPATVAAAAAIAPAEAAALPAVTVHEAIRRSDTPLAAFSPTFRRVMKPFGKYQVAAAGRPLRPTQPEPEAAPADLLEHGTSLRQRDTVLSRLVAGELTAAAPPQEQARLYQFDDHLIDIFLRREDVVLPVPALLAAAGGAARFQAAYASFRTVGVAAPPGEVQPVVGFRVPQFVRPRLPLEPLKGDVIAATAPGPQFQVKIKGAVPIVGTLPVPSPGDFEAINFNASHFYVGDFDEPMHLVGDWKASDFKASDFRVGRMVFDYETTSPSGGQVPTQTPAEQTPAETPAEQTPDAPPTKPVVLARLAQSARADAEDNILNTSTPAPTSTTVSAAAPPTDASIPVIKQAKVFPVFKDPMGEHLRQRHPELFLPGQGAFPTNGVAVLNVNPAFIEAYMVGLNHALGSELHWRGFPVDLRGTFFQQFWDVSDHFNMQLPASGPDAPSGAQEATMLDIKPLDKWVSNELGTNSLAPAGGGLLRLALRSELLARYPTLVLALQDNSLAAQGIDGTDPAHMLHPLQRLAVGQDLAVVTFGVDLTYARAHCALVLMERPGQPRFGLDAEPADAAENLINPLGWNDLTWGYAGTPVGGQLAPTTTGLPGTKPHATAEPASVAYLTDSASVAYALLQEPVLATLPLSAIF